MTAERLAEIGAHLSNLRYLEPRPGEAYQMDAAVVKEDLSDLLAGIAELEAELARVAPFLALHGFEGYVADGD